MDSEKAKYIKEISITLLSAYIIADSNENKNSQQRTPISELVSEAIYASEILFNELNKKGY